MEIKTNFDLRIFIQLEYALKLTFECLGIVGNLLMFVVYSSGSLRKMSISVYFRSVAFLCAFQNIYELSRYFLPTNSLENKHELVCKLSSFFYSFLKPTSAWLEILAGLDRYLTIVYPFRFNALKKRLTQSLLVAFVIVYNTACYAKILINAELLYSFYEDLDEYSSVCVNIVTTDLSLLDFLNGAAIPFCLMGIISILTFVGVRLAHSQVKSSFVNKSRRHRKLFNDIKFGMTMIVLSILFVLFNAPYRFYYILGLNLFEYPVLMSACEILFDSYYSMVFWIQLVVNSVVRKTTSDLMRRAWLRLFRR